MTIMREKDFTGYSRDSIHEAIDNAIEKAGEHQCVEVIETRSHHDEAGYAHYQATITTFQAGYDQEKTHLMATQE